MARLLLHSLGSLCVLLLVLQQRNANIAPPLSRTTAITTTPLADVPVFHLVFSKGGDSLSTLNLRCLESIFYFHPSVTVKLHANALLALPSGLQHPKLKALSNKGYDLRVLYYDPQETLREALNVPDSQVDSSLAFVFLSQMPNFAATQKYWYANEANLMRLCLLYTQGGIYLDTDVVLINNQLGSVKALDNAVGRHNDQKKFHNAVLKFTQPHNQFLARVLNNLMQNFDGLKWGNNGPKAFGRTAKEFPNLICNEMDIRGQTQQDNNKDCLVHPLPNEAVAPVSYKHWEETCFLPNSPSYQQSKHLIKDSLLVHFNNKVTGTKIMDYQKGSLCDAVLNSYCILCLEGEEEERKEVGR